MLQRRLQLRIRLFGRLADAIGPEIEMSVAGATVGDVRRRIAAEHAAAEASLSRSRALIAETFVEDERVVREEERLEFLPPVSGG
jgi:molybdopterin converting factor small subunit